MRRFFTWNALALLLRLAVAWYGVQVLAMVLLGTAAAGLAGIFAPSPGTPLDERLSMTALAGVGAGFMGGIFLFPFSAGVLALYGTFVQVRAAAPGPLGAFHRVRIPVPWTPEEASEAAAAFLAALGAGATERRGVRLQARFPPPEWAGRWRRWTQTDEGEVQVLDGTLEVTLQPASRLLYRTLWVDRGRNRARLERFEGLVSERLTDERRAEREAHRVDAQAARLAQAELLLLRAQVEPHFLFNTLAHLRELVRTGDTTTALSMVDALVTHARAATERVRQVSHPLGDEVATIEGYLALMQLRFGQRLSHSVKVPEEVRDVDVPVGTLLIPVENAVKHGLEPKRGGGTITVTAAREGTRLLLDILDDGVGLPPEPPTGTGLSNLRQRLRLAHGDQANLTVEDRDTGGVHVRITLPIRSH